MTTHGIIARPTADGWAGRYHHFSGFPAGLGRALFQIHQDHFKGDTAAMLRFLIDEHPAGWSDIMERDLSLPPGFIEMDNHEANPRRARCYCHGDRRRGDYLLSFPGFQDGDASWVYVIDEATHTMQIRGVHGSGRYKHWELFATIDLFGDEAQFELSGIGK